MVKLNVKTDILYNSKQTTQNIIHKSVKKYAYLSLFFSGRQAGDAIMYFIPYVTYSPITGQRSPVLATDRPRSSREEQNQTHKYIPTSGKVAYGWLLWFCVVHARHIITQAFHENITITGMQNWTKMCICVTVSFIWYIAILVYLTLVWLYVQWYLIRAKLPLKFDLFFKYMYTGEPCQHVVSGFKWALFSCITLKMKDYKRQKKYRDLLILLKLHANAIYHQYMNICLIFFFTLVHVFMNECIQYHEALLSMEPFSEKYNVL